MDINEEISSLFSSAVLVFFGGILSSTSGFIERLILARFLSQANYGEVNIGLTVLFLGGTIAMFGFYQAIPRYMSRFSTREDIRGAWYTGFVISFSLAIILSLFLYFGREIILSNLFENPDSDELIILFICAIPLYVGLRAGVGGIRGMEETRYHIYTMKILFPIGKLLFLGILLWFGINILAAGYAYILALFISFIVSIYLLNKLIALRKPVNFHWGEMTRFSAPLMISTIIVTLIVRTDTLMVGYFQSSTDVGLYSAAYPLAQTLLIVTTSFSFLYLPLASRMDAMESYTELDEIYSLTTKWIYIITFPAFLVFFTFSGDVLSIFFGEEYAAATGAFSILALGFFSNAAAGRCRETISALGYTRYNLIINATAFVLNFILNLVLIPRYSYTGASMASAAAYLATNAFALAIMKYQFNITPFSRHSVRVYAILPLVLLPIAIGISQFVTLSVLLLPFMLIVTGGITIIIVIIAGGVQPEDGVVLSYIEGKLGVEIPIIRDYVPSEDTEQI